MLLVASFKCTYACSLPRVLLRDWKGKTMLSLEHRRNTRCPFVPAVFVCLRLQIIEKRKWNIDWEPRASSRPLFQKKILFVCSVNNQRGIMSMDSYCRIHRAHFKKSSFRLICLSKSGPSDLWKINAKVSVLRHFPPVLCNPSKLRRISFSKRHPCYRYRSILLFLWYDAHWVPN